MFGNFTNWSNQNQEHVPLMIWIEPKEWIEQSTDNTVVIDLQNMLDKIENEIIQYCGHVTRQLFLTM